MVSHILSAIKAVIIPTLNHSIFDRACFHTDMLRETLWVPTFYGFRQEVSSRFGLLDPVALHGLAIFVESQEPGPTGLLLPVEQRRVDDVIVLEH